MGQRINRLWIVEKPSMARSLVDGLCFNSGIRVANDPRKDDFHLLSNGDAVCPLLGHLLEMEFLTPENRTARRGTYFDFLPMKVMEPKFGPRPDRGERPRGPISVAEAERNAPKAFRVVMRLMKDCKEIVNAGDIDREGQRIVDELLEYAGIDPAGANKPVWRLALVSNRPEDISKLAAKLERNGDPKWALRSKEAFVRQLLDAAVGMNGSFAMQEVMGRSNMSVGRVQTPVLWMVAQRDRAIENFRPRNFFVPVIVLADGTEMRWFKRDGAQGMKGFDEEGRIIDRALAQSIVDRIASGFAGSVTASDSKLVSVAPPLPFSGPTLSSTVAKRFGCTPKEAESAAQSLYERHKAISYVGTDCQFLPTSMLDDARGTLQSLARAFPKIAQGANTSLRSAAWNDAKVDEHYAIVPTGTLPNSATPIEREVFETVVKRYIAQFYPAHEFMRHSLAAAFGDDEFRSSRKEIVREGWKAVEGDAESASATRSEGDADQSGDSDADGGVDITARARPGAPSPRKGNN